MFSFSILAYPCLAFYIPQGMEQLRVPSLPSPPGRFVFEIVIFVRFEGLTTFRRYLVDRISL